MTSALILSRYLILLASAFFVAADDCDRVFSLLGDNKYQSNTTIGKGVILSEWLNEQIDADLQRECFPRLTIMDTSGFRGASKFFGTIPSAIGEMKSLELLDLSKSSLSGTIPLFFKDLKQLEMLVIEGNCITGNLDISMCALPPSISFIHAARNSITGTLPLCLGKMSELRYLNLDDNSLTGPIPSYVSEFNRLTELKLGKQGLTGTLPKLSGMANLNVVYLPQNKLSGTIPSTYLSLNLQTLQLYTNRLTGGIDAVRNVDVKVEVYNNQLTGTVPANFSARYFDAHGNKLTGTLPNSICYPKFAGAKYAFEDNDGLCISCSMEPGKGSISADDCSATTTRAGDPDQPLKIVAVIGSLLTVVIVVLGVCVLLTVHQRQRNRRKSHGVLSPVLMWAKNVRLEPIKGAFFIPFQQFEMGPLIAAGGAGNVYRATFGERAVAMKELIATLFDPKDERALADLQAEASLLCSLQHPNIVRFYGMTGRSTARGNSYYLVTDLKSMDLSALMLQNQPKQLEVLRMAKEITDALEFLHSVKVVHRDLKPANVLLDDARTVFLCDFGISKRTTEATNLTLNVGTAAYMAPELGKADNLDDEMSDEDNNDKRNSTSVTERDPSQRVSLAQSPSSRTGLATMLKTRNSSVSSYASMGSVSILSPSSLSPSSKHLKTLPEAIYKVDCFSFGMLLWAMMSWKLPFQGQTQFQILSSIAVHNRRPSTRAIAKTWPIELVAMVKMLWSRNPSDRPTISEAKAALVNQIESMEPPKLEQSAQAANPIDRQSKSRHILKQS